MRSSVDEVSPAGQCRGKPYDRAIESYDQDFGVCVECFCDVEVVANKVAQSGSVGVFVGWCASWDRDVCSSVCSTLIYHVESRLWWPRTR
jgi:hypothetical protein